MKTKHLTLRRKAASVGVSVAHYCAVKAHRAKPSYSLAKAMAKIEGVHFLHLLDPKEYDEKGKAVIALEEPSVAGGGNV